MAAAKMPRTTELPRPEQVPFPYESSYTTDVVVVGCGFAGLNAAVTAREQGCSVLVIDKGKPGYSGLSPWPSSFRWFDPERGDVEAAYVAAIREGGDYISNLNWYRQWIQESKGIYERLKDWGILAQYPRATDAGTYYEQEDFVGYRETFERFDRHQKWLEVLKRYDIPCLEHVMVADVFCTNGWAAGVVGFHVPSGSWLTVRAKAVILATGGGSYKPTGYPTGTNTFDGEYMAYQLGLPIAGKEFEDFHTTVPSAPGNVFFDNHWQYLENIWLCGGDVSEQDASDYAATKGKIMVVSRMRKAVQGVPASDGSEIQDVSTASYTRRGGSKVYGDDPAEVRSGKMSTPVAQSTLAGAATGMCCHLTSGVFCGMEELTGATRIPGLFTAGDGIHATSPSGAAYPCGVGFTSCFTSIDGTHAGEAAAKYAAESNHLEIPEETIQAKLDDLTAPLRVEQGFDPNWARDVLHAIMAPYWVSTAKTEETLQAALTQVCYMRDHVMPKLSARTGHDLRLCLEMRHKILSAEMKLRASLTRRESRGNHYRTDIPYRDDANYLCYILACKNADGTMRTEKTEPLPSEWTGDITLPYTERYHFYFPGEQEAKGFEAPRDKGPWKGGKRG